MPESDQIGHLPCRDSRCNLHDEYLARSDQQLWKANAFLETESVNRLLGDDGDAFEQFVRKCRRKDVSPTDAEARSGRPKPIRQRHQS